ncbi:MAG: undecaprenyl/decaprenyl-phosphate alpha-N-acetylglucosaminyl 1-phosphate transferase, partial [Coriobacteriales bacterium]
MTIMQYAVLIGVAAVVTLVVTPIVRALGTKWGIVAHPGGRHVHTGLIPRIGGVAMFAGFVAA